MAMGKFYRGLKRWTDRDIASSTRPISLMLPFMVFALLTVPFRVSDVTFWPWIAVVVGALCLTWLIWGVSRAVHVLKVADWKASKQYERKGRYLLSREYHETVFASKTRRLERKERADKTS